jgi:hypothetical protein
MCIWTFLFLTVKLLTRFFNFKIEIMMPTPAVLLDDFASTNPKKAEIQWSEQREYVLVNIIKNRNAHCKTKGAKMEDKKLIAFNDLRLHPSFSDVRDVVTLNGIMQKFNRLKTYVKSKYALDAEGANLSGLPENPPRVEALLYKMIQDEMQTKVSVSLKKKKEDERADRLKALQDQELARQVRMQPSVSSDDGPGSEERTSSLSSSQESEDGKGKKRKSTATPSPPEDTWMQYLREKAKRREEEAGEDGSLKKLLLTLEEKRLAMEVRREEKQLAMEERRLLLEERRLLMEEMIHQNQKTVFELLAKDK